MLRQEKAYFHCRNQCSPFFGS